MPDLYTIHEGDCLALMRSMADNSVDAVITDPPYGLNAMPEAAIRGCLTAWLAGDVYTPKGRGFMGKIWDAWVPGPEVWREALRVAKPGAHILCFAGTRTVDLMGIALRLGGWEIREQVYWCHAQGFPKSLNVSVAIDKAGGNSLNMSAPATDAAKQWDGWHTALKPSVEPCILARKPLSEATVAANVLRWGTGGINVAACRVGDEYRHNHSCRNIGNTATPVLTKGSETEGRETIGRFPANLILEQSPEALAPFGAAARFFYTAKANKGDREGALHPTMKPTDLMRYLCRLITPPGGLVLDPFAGSGSTGKAAILEGFRALLMEREAEYIPIIRARCQAAQDTAQGDLFHGLEPIT